MTEEYGPMKVIENERKTDDGRKPYGKTTIKRRWF